MIPASERQKAGISIYGHQRSSEGLPGVPLSKSSRSPVSRDRESVANGLFPVPVCFAGTSANMGGRAVLLSHGTTGHLVQAAPSDLKSVDYTVGKVDCFMRTRENTFTMVKARDRR